MGYYCIECLATSLHPIFQEGKSEDQWRNRRGVGQSAPWHFSPGNFSNLPGKNGKGRKGKWSGKEGKFEREEVEKLKMEGERFFFVLFLLVTFWNHWNLFGCTKMDKLYREKSYSMPGKIRKTDFAPSEKYSSYAPAEDLEKTCRSEYGLETKCTYRARTVNRTQAHLCIASGKNRYATCFP